MAELLCYRCGTSLAALSLPLSRLDECPSCSVHLHCCRMCRYYDPSVTEECTEEDAEEVREKARANFCDYFKPGDDGFDPAALEAEARSRQSLEALFGESDEESDQGGADGDGRRDSDGGLSDAEDLFR